LFSSSRMRISDNRHLLGASTIEHSTNSRNLGAQAMCQGETMLGNSCLDQDFQRSNRASCCWPLTNVFAPQKSGYFSNE
jgi:hypothetical protein